MIQEKIWGKFESSTTPYLLGLVGKVKSYYLSCLLSRLDLLGGRLLLDSSDDGCESSISLESNLRKVSVYTISAPNFFSCLLYLPEYVLMN